MEKEGSENMKNEKVDWEKIIGNTTGEAKVKITEKVHVYRIIKFILIILTCSLVVSVIWLTVLNFTSSELVKNPSISLDIPEENTKRAIISYSNDLIQLGNEVIRKIIDVLISALLVIIGYYAGKSPNK